jgi:rhodanese-related sulfurtransferase
MGTTTVINAVPPAEVARLRAAGRPFELIDVRTPAEYAAVHAEGARLVPLDALEPRAALAARQSPGDAPVFLICRSGARAAKACEAFAAAGVAGVSIVDGGTDAWERAGLPVVRGPGRVISLERQVRIAAGTLVLVGAALALAVHPLFIALSAFVGAGLVFAGVTDWCGMGLMLARMPWNQRGGAGASCSH